MSRFTIAATVCALCWAGAIVRAGTTGEQQTVRSDLAGLATAARESGVRPPAVVVIGNVVDVLDTAAMSRRA